MRAALQVDSSSVSTTLDELNIFIRREYGYLDEISNNATWAIYSRVSRVDPKFQGYSLEIQPDRAEEYARAHGAQKVENYSDPNKTGRNSRRKELQRLIRDVISGRIQVVVVHRLDRLYRNLESVLGFVRLLKRYKVGLISVTENIDTNTPYGLQMLALLGMMAETYVHQTSERTREAKAHRARSGLPNGYLPLGYCNGLCSTCSDSHGKGICPMIGMEDRPESQRGRVAVPHPVTRYAISWIFELFQKGYSYREIADWLNSHDFTLPDGQSIRYRTKGKTLSNPLGLFSRDSIRAIIENPFFAGLVARYERPDLDMSDDPENPEKKTGNGKKINSRRVIELQQGKHEALISLKDWKTAQHMRKMKGRTPTSAAASKRIYPLTGVSRCWVCFEHNGGIVTLRGGTLRNDRRTYRCAALQDRHSSKHKHLKINLKTKALKEIKVQPNPMSQDVVDRHTTRYLSGDKLEAEVDRLIERIKLPDEIKEKILAYYVSDEGLSAFERENFNLRQSLKRFQELYKQGDIDKAEYEEQAHFILQRLRSLKPSANPAAQDVLLLLADFPGNWSRMLPGEKRVLLNIMFKGLYFDSQGKLRKILAHPPFDVMFGLED
ncbi:MAG: recombinase family protein [Anaerolineales bacterium]|nr:recombinase family protein [Anaerolineales bacterium]